MGDLPVYDVVLLPPQEVDDASVRLSRRCASFAATEFVLTPDGPYSHLSLFMANFDSSACAEASALLRGLSARTPSLPLQGDHFSGNDQGMFELFYRASAGLTKLQEDVIAALAPLRTGLRRRDPVGRVLAEYRLTAPAVARDNLERWGYDEVGELFRPHITVARFVSRGDALSEPLDPRPFSGLFTTLALCVMGEHGTCTEIVETYALTAEAPSPAVP
ncbi:2'-5' RNA ligase family protein [Nonomuraea sp. NPDC050556]|uniref:2'-5' RNA ligase family protein n=1 Tax=Nonomuraea sp. NPDC050556 TaxID=3364369 RepID=UPI003799FEFC